MTAIKDAFNSAGITGYRPTSHAIHRAELRYGVDATDVYEWVNGLMDGASIVGFGGRDQKNPIYESTEGIRLVIDEARNAVVTILGDVSTDFLRPTLEREKRKLDRLYTRNIRRMELQYAEELRELADMAVNRAKARNPKTRELIAERMADKQDVVCGLLTEIERNKDEWQSRIRAIEVIAE